MKKISLQDFIEHLDNLKAEGFQGDKIQSYLAHHHIDQDEFAPFIFFREETYGRNLVTRGKLYELLVMTWLPGQQTPIHEHEGSACWMTVQSGKLSLRHYKPLTTDPHQIVPNGPSETHVAGETFFIDDTAGIYSIINTSTKPAVSVHIYARPVEECRIYNENLGKFEWTEMTYFTDPSTLEGSSFPH